MDLWTTDEGEISQAFGRRLKELRRRAELTQEGLSHAAGVDRSYVGQVERGERNVTLVNIAKLAAGLGACPEELLQGVPALRTAEAAGC